MATWRFAPAAAWLGACLLLGGGCAGPPVVLTEEQRQSPPTLNVGDPAPALAVSEWVQGDPVGAFEPGRVYVVDFWASWCGPCFASLPHLSEVQDRWGDRVCVIAMSTVDQENSPSNIRAAVRKLGNGLRVRVAVDRGRQSSERYPVAVRDTAVPRSFIIDAQGRLAWYGHPMDMDPVLESVVAGTWDLQQARECFAKSNAAGRETQRLASRYLEASDRRDLEGILAAAEAVCAYPVDDVRGLSPATWGWWVRVRTLAELGRGAEAEEVANLGMQTAGVADDPGALANMAGALSSSPKGLELAERAIALMREEEAKPANTVWEKYLRDGDKLRYAAIRHQCAAVLAEHARNGEAAELVRQAVEVWPDDKRLLPSRAQLVADLKKYEAAAR